MSERYRLRWDADDLAKLKGMAGNFPTAHIAKELGRGISATIMKAHALRLSLRTNTRRYRRDDPPRIKPGRAGFDLS
jgi:hypothetical protein